MVKKKAAVAKPIDHLKDGHITNMSWNELRAFAKSRGIPAKGTRIKLEAKVKKLLSVQGPADISAKTSKSASSKNVATKTAAKKKAAVSVGVPEKAGKTALSRPRGLSDASNDFKVGQRVEVRANEQRGKVVDVTSVIEVVLAITGLTEKFSAGELKKLEPIL